jgi:hypothetical protein
MAEMMPSTIIGRHSARTAPTAATNMAGAVGFWVSLA